MSRDHSSQDWQQSTANAATMATNESNQGDKGSQQPPSETLGSNTANSFHLTAPEHSQHDENNQVFLQIEPVRKIVTFRDVRREKHSRSKVFSLISYHARQSHMYPGKWHPAGDCQNLINYFASIRTNRKALTASFGGVIQCNQVFVCPTCAKRINAYRRQEIAQAAAKARAENIQPIMVTFTFPHRRDTTKQRQHQLQTLKALIDKQAKAIRYFKSGKNWHNLKADISLQGSIKALEITFSTQNGWHPHTHELWFISPETNLDQLKASIQNQWLKAVRRAGITVPSTRDFFEKAIDITANANLDVYLAKDQQPKDIKLAHELAGFEKKRPRGQSLSPMYDLLDHPKFELYNPNNFWHSKYLEYLEGTKGKHALRWSPGLKQWAGLNEVADDEVPDSEGTKTIGWISRTAYRFIRETPDNETEVLMTALEFGFPGVKKWLSQKGIEPAKHAFEGENAPGRPPKLTPEQRRENTHSVQHHESQHLQRAYDKTIAEKGSTNAQRQRQAKDQQRKSENDQFNSPAAKAARAQESRLFYLNEPVRRPGGAEK